MAGDGEPQRPIDGMRDANARGNLHFRDDDTVITDLQMRARAEQVEAVVGQPREAEGLAEAAGAGGEHAGLGLSCNAAIGSHAIEAGERLEGAQEKTASETRSLAADIHAVITTVDGIHISKSGWAEEDGVAGRGPAMGVGGGIGRVVVGTEVGLDLDDAPNEALRAVRYLADKEFA